MILCLFRRQVDESKAELLALREAQAKQSNEMEARLREAESKVGYGTYCTSTVSTQLDLVFW